MKRQFDEFNVNFLRLWDDLHEIVKKTLRVRQMLRGSLRDDIDNWVHDIFICQLNFEEYRAHLAQKEDEGRFDKEFYSKLKPGEAIVIADWKMKILPMEYRESQQKFFAKRGFSCLGFLVITLSEDDPKKVNLHYHLYLSDDSTQDSDAVNEAKRDLYTKLNQMGILRVHYRADGAGCFSGASAKGPIIHWHEWTGVTEASYKISVAGCGKTMLDGLFGIFTMHIQQLVNEGGSYQNAEDLFCLLSDNPISATYIHVIKPDRTKTVSVGSKDLGHCYLIECDIDNKNVIVKQHSRHGSGKAIAWDDLKVK